MADQTQETGSRGAEIVSLREVARDTRYPILTDLEAHWQHLRGSRLVPARSDVDPRRIEDALEYAFILERVAPGTARFRLAGMHLNDLMGMEVRGMPLSAFFEPRAREGVSQALESVFDDPAIARLSLSAETGVGRPPLDARLLLLPLKSDFGDVSRALGCLVTLGPTGRAPRRFAIDWQEVTAIAEPGHRGDRRIGGWSRQSAPTPPARAVPAPADRAAGGAGSTVPAQSPRPKRASGRPNLYLVTSDD